jgi:transposase-like protein
MAGRPSKRRDATKEAILQSLRQGATRTAAAEAAGVHRNTFARWVDEDEAFCGAVKKAEGDAELMAVKVVVGAMHSGTWQAAAWWLERRRRDEYAQKSIQQHEGNAEKPVHVITFVRDGG